MRVVLRRGPKTIVVDRAKEVRVWPTNRGSDKEGSWCWHIKHATPPWLTVDQAMQISDLYKEASRLTEVTGVRYEVDHIVPVRGKNICGLHVPWNLQVVTKSENARKQNRL